jgi:putative sterol carrier protein
MLPFGTPEPERGVGIEVFTEEWSRSCLDRLNERPGYRAAAASWTDAVVLVVTADRGAGFPEDRAIHLELDRGVCREARLASAADRTDAPIVLTGAPPVWRELLQEGADPVQAVLQGRLRLERGSPFVLARFAAAAREMVAAAAAAGGTFPSPA